MATAGNLVVNIGSNAAGLVKGLGTAEGAVGGFASTATSMFAKVAAAVGFIGAGAAVGGMLKLASNFEMVTMQFEVMLGSADAAKKMVAGIREFAIESPFGNVDLFDAAKLLLNFGMSAESIIPSVKMLGDIAAGDTEKLHRLALAFAQSSAAGRLMGQDLLQMVNAGFNPLQEISRITGESMASLKKKMEAGAISFDMVEAAFKSATSEGGRFFGMTERIAGTTAGKWMVLKDKVVELGLAIGTSLLPMANLALQWAEAFMVVFAGMPGVMSNAMGTLLPFVEANAEWLRISAIFITILAALAVAMKAVTLATQAYAKAQMIAQAFSGPKGWLILLGAVTAASVGTIALNSAFETMNAEMENAKPATVAAGIGELGTEATNALNPLAQLKDGLDPLKESGYTTALEKVTNEIRVLRGVATEASLELEKMFRAGVGQEELKHLNAMWQLRDKLVEQQKASKEATEKQLADQKKMEEDAEAAAEREAEIAAENAARAVFDEKNLVMDLTKSKGGGMDVQDAPQNAFAQRGSAEAYKLVADIRGGRDQPVVHAVEQQTKEVVQGLNVVAASVGGLGLGGLLGAFPG